MKKTAVALILLGLTGSIWANNIETGVDAQPRNSSCIRNNGCIVATSHWANVINRSGALKTIYVTYQICPQNEDCRKDTYKVVVQPGTWSDGKIMTLMAKYHYMGDFYLDATTTITDENRIVLSTMTKRGMVQVHG